MSQPALLISIQLCGVDALLTSAAGGIVGDITVSSRFASTTVQEVSVFVFLDPVDQENRLRKGLEDLTLVPP